jgi:hypothetical protein
MDEARRTRAGADPPRCTRLRLPVNAMRPAGNRFAMACNSLRARTVSATPWPAGLECAWGGVGSLSVACHTATSSPFVQPSYNSERSASSGAVRSYYPAAAAPSARRASPWAVGAWTSTRPVSVYQSRRASCPASRPAPGRFASVAKEPPWKKPMRVMLAPRFRSGGRGAPAGGPLYPFSFRLGRASRRRPGRASSRRQRWQARLRSIGRGTLLAAFFSRLDTDTQEALAKQARSDHIRQVGLVHRPSLCYRSSC